MNRGDGIFEDVTQQTGLGSGFLPLGFGTKLFDVDNDGDLDIHVTNGHVIDNVEAVSAEPDLRAEGSAVRERRRQIQGRVGAERRRAAEPTRVGRGLAVADFDNDGFLDVAISSVGRRAGAAAQPRRARRGNWIAAFARRAPRATGFGLGATVRVQTPAACRSARSTTPPAT